MPSRSHSALTTTINELAASFASELLAAIARAHLHELESTSAPVVRQAGRPRSKQGRPTGAPRGDRSAVLGRVLGLLGKQREGLRAEDIRRTLRLDKPAFVRAAADGLATGEIRKEGRLRATKYFAAE